MSNTLPEPKEALCPECYHIDGNEPDQAGRVQCRGCFHRWMVLIRRPEPEATKALPCPGCRGRGRITLSRSPTRVTRQCRVCNGRGTTAPPTPKQPQ